MASMLATHAVYSLVRGWPVKFPASGIVIMGTATLFSSLVFSSTQGRRAAVLCGLTHVVALVPLWLGWDVLNGYPINVGPTLYQALVFVALYYGAGGFLGATLTEFVVSGKWLALLWGREREGSR